MAYRTQQRTVGDEVGNVVFPADAVNHLHYLERALLVFLNSAFHNFLFIRHNRI
jgi:hypothetical protein